MKTSLGLTIVGSTLLLAAQGHAQAVDKFYFDLNAGAALPQDAGIRVSPFGNDGKVQFNTGLRGDVDFGYNFNSSLAAELQSGVIWNSIHSIHGNTLSTVNANADLYQIPVLANLIYKPLHGAFEPYIGVGVGGTESTFDSSNVPLFGTKFTATDFTFAYQAEAGFKYSVSQDIQLGLGYEFLGTMDHNWSDHGITFKTDGTMTHAVLATFTWQF